MKSKKTILVIVLLALCLAATVACKPGGGTLVSPTITLEGNVVSWQAVENAASYGVKVGSDAEVSVTATSYTINKTEVGSYKITVTAKSADDKWKDSAPSNEVTYVVESTGTEKTALTAPVISLNGNTVSWTAVPNAASYDVKVDNAAPINVTATSYTLPQTAVGSYKVTVVAKAGNSETYKDSAPSNEVTYVINEEIEVTLTEIEVNPVGIPATIYLDQGITELDLSQIVITAYYSNNTEKTVELSDVVIGDYDLTTAGRKTVTVTYTENGVTADPFVIRVDVKERSVEDIDEYDALLIEYSSTGEYVIDGTDIRNMKGENVLDNGVVALNQGKTLLSVDGRFVVVTVARFVSDKEGFLAIADDMDGYYVLTKDIDFGGGYYDYGTTRTSSAILGAVPYDEEGLLDYQNGTGNSSYQEGIPFNGTLDGQGYSIKNVKLHYSDELHGKYSCGVSIIGYVGEQGAICNITLRNIQVQAKKYASFLVGYNKGTIENICVEADCSMNSWYGCGYLVAGYNDGEISNIVSHLATYDSNSAKGLDITASNNSDIEDGNSKLNGTSGNCYVADKTDLTANLGAGWKYFEGLGTVLVNDDYIYVRNVKDTLSIGERWYLNLALGSDVLEPNFAFYGVNNGEDNNAVITFGWDGEVGSHYIELTNPATAVDLIGTKITMAVYSADWKTSVSVEFTVSSSRVNGYEKDTETLDVVEGTDIDLTAIDITAKYTDGTTQTIHPLKVEGYDKAGTVGEVQTVKAFYGEGEDDYVEIAVTLIAKSVESIEIDTASTYKTVYNVGDELDLTGLKIVVTYNNGVSESIAVTSAMLSECDMSVAGGKQITITHGGKTCVLNVTVNEVGVTVTSIAINGSIAKTTYKLNEEVTLADLAGATVTAANSNGTTTEDIAITLAMVSYSFDTVGQSAITVTYEGKTATITVTVADYATALTVTPKSTSLRYNAETALDLVANATYSLTMASGETKAVTTGITVSEYKPGLNTITYTYTDEYATVTAAQQYEIWYEIASANEWKAINNNLAGYYVMTSDIDFESGYLSPIGQAPLKAAAEGYEFDNDVTNSIADLPARAFTGKFDGQGYVLKNAKIHNDAFTQAAAYSMSAFGFIGEGGEVKNVTFRNISVRGGKLCAIIASYNLGLIENIVIEKDCYLESYYAEAGAAASRNYGTIKNVVSLLTTYDAIPSAAWGGLNKELPMVYDGNTSRVTDCYIGNTSDLTALENSSFTFNEETKTGWKYFENLGTVYVNSDYVYIRQTVTDLPENGRLYLNLAFVEDKNFIMQEWSDSEFEMLWDGEVGSHYIVVTSVGTERNDIAINVRNGSWKGSHVIYINITDPIQEGL